MRLVEMQFPRPTQRFVERIRGRRNLTKVVPLVRVAEAKKSASPGGRCSDVGLVLGDVDAVDELLFDLATECEHFPGIGADLFERADQLVFGAATGGFNAMLGIVPTCVPKRADLNHTLGSSAGCIGNQPYDLINVLSFYDREPC